ncbi:MAG: TraB/GumN family protein [Bacteroidota bacterium]
MRFAITLVLAFLVSLNLSAQKNKRTNYKLLWKISGNGLSKPSYLFGTMHVQDKRGFDFNDSVIAKVIQCEAFAMEVHPDSITRFITSLIFNEDKAQTIKSLMTTKEYALYDSLLKKKTGLSLKNFSTVKQAKYFVEQHGVKKDKSTFLDAWLYNIARENGKSITGLENIDVQMRLFQDEDSTELEDFKASLRSESAGDNTVQTLFNLYYDGDVEIIDKYVRSISQPGKFKKMVVDRNINMTDNIVREIHKRTVFMAVGAAHLGGEKGIVNLLKQKGYTVVPVTAPFSGTASKYKFKGTTPGEWFNFSSPDGGYAVEMPQQPLPLDMPGVPIKFQASLDIGTLTIYMAAHLPLGLVVEDQAASKALDKMVSNMSSSQKVTNVKKITMDGYEGRELETLAGGHMFKVRFTICKSNAYMLMAGPSKESANSPDAKRFLSSLKIMKPVNAGVEHLVSKEGAFSADMPGKVTKQVTTPTDPNSGRPLKISVFFSTDNNTGSSYLVRYNDFEGGYVSNDDSTYIAAILQSVDERMKGVDLSVDEIDFRGYGASHFSLSNAERTAKIEGIVTLRGERFYLLMNTHASGADGEKDGKAFFDSFKFEQFDKPALKDLSFPEGFALKVPTTFEADSTVSRSTDETIYSFVDHLSGMTFLVSAETYEKYEQRDHIDSLFAALKKKYSETMNDVSSVRDSTIAGKLPTHEYLLQSEKDNSIVRVRAVLAGDMQISLWGYIPAHEDLTLPDDIFDSFKVTHTSDWSILTDKTDLILEGITSADSAGRMSARSALGRLRYKNKYIEPSKIYAALKKSYPDDGEWYSMRSLLFEILAKINDKTTQGFIEEIYPTLPDSTVLPDKALAVLTSLKTHESVRKMADLVAASKSDKRFSSYNVLYPLTDSLELLNDVVIDLLNSRTKFESTWELYHVIRAALDSNLFTTERRSEVISMMTDIAEKIANSPASSEKDNYYEVQEEYSVIQTLSSIPFTPQIERIVRKFAEKDNEDNKFLCVQLLLKNNVNVLVKDINWLASKPTIRLSLYEELAKYNKQKQISKKYTTEKMLAESEIYDYMEDDDEYPSSVRFQKEKYVIANGERKKILIFTCRYDEGEGGFTAIAGPYALKSKAFIRGEATGSLWDEYKTDKELNEKLKEYLEKRGMKLE